MTITGLSLSDQAHTLAVWLTAGASAVVLLLALALCACKEKPNTHDNEAKLENIEKRKSRAASDENQVQETSLTDVRVEDVTKRQSNGSAKGNNRPRSHDRALPDIPGNSVGVGDDEDEADPRYDVIVKKERPNQTPDVNQRIQREVAQNVTKNHPYEKVKGAERPYESVSDIKENGDAPVKEEELYAGPRSEGGSDYYASVGECGVEYTKRDGTKEIIKTKKELDNEEETYVQAPGPPVPKKNFEPISIDTNTISPPSPQCPQQQSPELPPRNTLSQSTVVSPPSAVTSPANSEAVSLVSSPNSPPIVNNIQNVSNDPAQQPQGAGPKVDPKYSKVTARESLQHMKEREAQMEQNSDVQYDYIKYEDVKGAGIGNVQVAPPQMVRTSMTSELYAEINTGTTSQRSSTYARVGDQKTLTGQGAAPELPSIQTLQQISHKDNRDASEPGYSSILSGQVPQPQVPPPLMQPASELYAQVDKDRKRSTIHVDSNVEIQVRSVTPTLDDMYAKVDKESKRRSGGGATDVVLATTSTSAPQGFGGARPKVKVTEESGSGDSVPGYATVKDAVRDSNIGYEQVVLENGVPVIPVCEEPGYSTVSDGNRSSQIIEPGYSTVGQIQDNGSDYDPNYETVTMATGGGTSAATSWTKPVIADPVYQEIPEVKKKIPHSKHSKHSKKKSK